MEVIGSQSSDNPAALRPVESNNIIFKLSLNGVKINATLGSIHAGIEHLSRVMCIFLCAFWAAVERPTSVRKVLNFHVIDSRLVRSGRSIIRSSLTTSPQGLPRGRVRPPRQRVNSIGGVPPLGVDFNVFRKRLVSSYRSPPRRSPFKAIDYLRLYNCLAARFTLWLSSPSSPVSQLCW